MKESVERAFTSHILRYVGVGLISGSIVHMGTLGGGTVHYILLVALGVTAFIVGTLMEKKMKDITPSLIIISVLLAIGVGMVSGSTQHYLDGPVYASFLLPIGLFLGYTMFALLEEKKQLTPKKVLIGGAVSLLLFVLLYGIAHLLPTLEPHHNQTEGHH